MFKRLLSAAVVFGAAALAPPVFAQANTCQPRDAIIEKLEDRYSEMLTAGGLQNAQQLLEIWTSASGSFTVLVTRPDGISCVVATGQGWHSVVQSVPDGVAS